MSPEGVVRVSGGVGHSSFPCFDYVNFNELMIFRGFMAFRLIDGFFVDVRQYVVSG